MKTNIFEDKFLKRLKNYKDKYIVELCIESEKDFYNNFSYLSNRYNNNVKINSDIIEYLINETENMPLKHSLMISIKTSNLIIQNIDFIIKMIKENIYYKLSIINSRIKRLNVHSVILALIGMLLIGMTHIFGFITKQYSINEFIIVISWVFMWKAVDLIFFEKAGMLKKRKILAKIYFSEITIEDVQMSKSNFI